MELEKQKRIAQLICGHIAGKLTDEDARELEAWKNRSERHRACLREWCDEENQAKLLAQINAFDLTEGRRTVTRRRNRRRLRRYNTAAAIVTILLGSIFLLRRPQEESAIIPLPQQENIEAGKRQARLVMASGRTVGLDTLQQLEAEELTVRNEQGIFVIQTAADTVGQETPTYHCVEVPAGGEFDFRLPDGTQVYLNAESRLRFPARFMPGKERRIFLAGEAYFNVARDTSAPFSVALEHTTVTVLGTSFNVSAYPGENREITTLVEGAVNIAPNAGGCQLRLSPGQQGNYDATLDTLTRQAVDVSYYTAWKNGVFAFHKQPLEQVMRTLSRWYIFEPRYADPALKSILYTGKIARHATIEEVLHTFELLDEVRFDIRGKEITVSRK